MSAPFAKIIQGPPGTTETSPQALVLDRQNNVVYSVGDSQATSVLETAIFESIAQTALANVTTAQNLFSKALNKGLLNYQNRIIEISGYLIYTTPGTTTPTLTIAVTLGGTTMVSITTAALSATASTNMPVNFWFTIMTATTGASGTIEAHGMVNANISANTPAAAVASYSDTNSAVSSAINLTSALTLNVTVAASSSVTSVQLRQLAVEVIN